MERVRETLSDERLECLNRIVRAMTSTLDLDQVVRLICESVVKDLGYRMTWVGLIEEGTLDVMPAAQAGFEKGYLSSIKVKWDDSPLGRGPTGAAIRNRHPAFMRHIDTDPSYEPWREHALKRGYRSSAAFPLVIGEKVIGALNVYSDNPDAFGEGETLVLEAFANQAAIAIENARLHEMAKSERDKLAAIMAGMEDGIDVVSKDYIVKFQNQLLVERFGDLTGQLCYKGYMGLEEPCEFCPMVKAIETGKPHRVELVGKDGRDYALISMPLRNPDGSVDAIEIVRDITEGVRAEEALRQLKDFNENIVQNMGEGIVVEDAQGYITFINPAAAALLGYDAEELVGQHWTVIVPPDQQPVVEAANERRARGESGRYELELVHKDGTRIPVLVSGNPRFEEDRFAGTLAVFTDITERKQAEHEIEERRLYLERLLTAAPDAIVTLDSRHRIVEWNPGAERLFGYSREEVIGQNLDDLVTNPDTYEEAVGYTQIVLNGKDVLPVETVRYRKDGSPVDVIAAGSPILVKDELIGIVAVYTDITERKRAEGALKESEEKFRNLAEQSPNMIFINKKGRVVYANQRSEEVMGYTREEFYSPDFHFLTLIAPESREVVKSAFAKHMKGDEVEPYEYTLITKDGRRIEAILTARLIDYEGERAILGIVTDITERKRAQEALYEQVQILSSIRDTIVIITPEMKTIYANQTAKDLFGDRPEMFTEPCYRFFKKRDNICEDCPVIEVFKDEKPHKAILKSYDKHGREMWRYNTAFPFYDQDGRLIAAIEIVTDYTAQKMAEMALRQSEERYRSVVENSHAGIIILDDAYRHIYVNDELCRISGYSREEIIGQDFRRFLDDESKGLVADRYVRRQKGEEVPPRYEFNIIRKDGEKRRMEISSTVIKDSAGRVNTVAQILDITERKRAEEEIRRRSEELAALNAIAMTVTSTLRLQEVLQAIQERVMKLLDEKYPPLFTLFNEEDQTFEVALTHVQEQPLRRVEKLLGIRFEELAFPLSTMKPALREALLVGKPYVTDDGSDLLGPGTSRRLIKGTRRAMGVKWIMDLPLWAKGKLVGTMVLFSQKEKVPDEEMELLSAIASQAAIAIENARLFEGERRRATQLAVINEVSRKAISILDLDEMLEEVARSICSGFDYYNVALFVVDKERHEAVIEAVAGGFEHIVLGEYRQSLDQGIIGWVIRTGRSWLANDVSQDPHYIKGFLEEVLTKSELCVPIQLGEEVIGALDIQSTHLNAFDETDVMAMETLCGQIAIAIENARLYEEMKRRVTELSILQEAAMAAARLSDSREALRAIVEELHEALGFSNVQVWLLNEKAQQLVTAASVGYPVPATIKPKLGEGITGWVAQHRQPQNVPDVSRDPRYICGDERVRSELAVPLEVGDRLIGVLNIEHYDLNAFSEDDVRLLSALAGQISVAIESARLRDEERKRTEELSILLDTAQTVVSSLDLAQLLETIASQAKELTQADGSRIYLLEPDEETLKALVVLEKYAEEIVATPVRVGQGITGHVAVTGIGEIVNHAERDPRAVQIPGTPEEAQCLMCAPLTVKGEVIGVMTLSREGEKKFEEGDLRLLTSLASQAATAIENARLYEETKRLAATDPLTGVWNRRHIEEHLRSEMARTRRFGHELSVLVMDIDNLKLFNDTYGHPVGDEVIRTVAQVVLTSCREIDVLGRYGGDELALLLPETGSQGAAMVAERILTALEKEPFQAPDGTKVPISISIGAASYPSDSEEADRLFSLADAAMYRVKVVGGGQFASPTVGPEEVAEELVARFDVLQGLLIAVDSKDHYSFKHSQEVTERACTLAQAVGLSKEESSALEVAGRLHDIGKIGIPTSVLRKPGPLTPEEWKIVQEHPRLGYLILQQVPQMETVLQALLHHHERYDGKGYPSGLQDEKIPLLSRILAVSDAFSAMTTDRPYRKALTVQEALDELRRNAGKQFDPHLAQKFIELVEKGKIE